MSLRGTSQPEIDLARFSYAVVSHGILASSECEPA